MFGEKIFKFAFVVFMIIWQGCAHYLSVSERNEMPLNKKKLSFMATASISDAIYEEQKVGLGRFEIIVPSKSERRPEYFNEFEVVVNLSDGNTIRECVDFNLAGFVSLRIKDGWNNDIYTLYIVPIRNGEEELFGDRERGSIDLEPFWRNNPEVRASDNLPGRSFPITHITGFDLYASLYMRADVGTSNLTDFNESVCGGFVTVNMKTKVGDAPDSFEYGPFKLLLPGPTDSDRLLAIADLDNKVLAKFVLPTKRFGEVVTLNPVTGEVKGYLLYVDEIYRTVGSHGDTPRGITWPLDAGARVWIGEWKENKDCPKENLRPGD